MKTSFRLQWSCLQIIALWEDTRKECGLHLTTSALDADPLRKRRLSSTFSVNAHLLRGADIDYLVLQFWKLDGDIIRWHQARNLVYQSLLLVFNDFCRECTSAEEEETVIHFLSQSISLARCRYRLFGSTILVSLTELSYIDVKHIVSFIKHILSFIWLVF